MNRKAPRRDDEGLSCLSSELELNELIEFIEFLFKF